jgi:pre-mRNA-splicing factor SPF27
MTSLLIPSYKTKLIYRLENTNILQSYGPNAWLVRNYQLNSQLTELQSTLSQLKDKVTEVNRQRRVYQEDTGKHLSRLEGRWGGLVAENVQLEMAVLAMEGELRGLRRKEEELTEEVRQLEQA